MSTTNASDPFEHLVGADVRELLNLPIEEARSLPNEAYTDPGFFRLEQQRLFARTWMFAARASELSNPGDILPVDAGGVPVVLTRDDDGEIHAFENVCLHRGSRLIDKPCTGQQRIVCPYHAWTYDLDGALRTRPHFDGPGKHDKRGGALTLLRCRFALWHDLVFVNVSGTAPAFETYIERLEAHLDGHDPGAYSFGNLLEFEFQVNWKLALENFLDIYHVFHVHPGLSAEMTDDQRFPTLPDGNFLYNRYFATEKGDKAEVLEIPGNEDRSNFSRVMGMLFPTLGIGFHPTHMAVYQFVPKAVDRTALRMSIYFSEEARSAHSFEQTRQGMLAYWSSVHQEDEDICRFLQHGRECPSYDGGRFAPYWDAGTLAISRLVVEGVTHQ